jgi:hypothetical protein
MVIRGLRSQAKHVAAHLSDPTLGINIPVLPVYIVPRRKNPGKASSRLGTPPNATTRATTVHILGTSPGITVEGATASTCRRRRRDVAVTVAASAMTARLGSGLRPTPGHGRARERARPPRSPSPASPSRRTCLIWNMSSWGWSGLRRRRRRPRQRSLRLRSGRSSLMMHLGKSSLVTAFLYETGCAD